MKFHYQIRDQEGEIHTGEVEASSQEAALQIIGRPDVFVTVLEQTDRVPLYAIKLNIFGGVKNKDVMLFSRQLSIMFEAQVSLLEALQSIASQTANKSFSEQIYRMSEEVEGGMSFSRTISKYPKIFSPFYVSMVKRGEALGNLADVLVYLADHLEREYYLTGKLKTAMIYPAFVLLVAVAVIILLMTMVIPNLADILEESGQQLPITTRIVIGTSNFLITKGWIVALALGAAVFGFLRYIKTPEGKRLLDYAILEVPVMKSFLKTAYLARFGENLATLIAGGVPLVQALDITGDIVGNTKYREIIEQAKEDVEGGAHIHEVLRKHPSEFPPMFSQMVSVGEQSGSLEKTLQSIVKFYQKEVERNVDGFLSLIEPALIVFLGVVVGGLMASVILPLYQVTSTF
jgi:type II secretory pathway component PulF